MQIPFKVYSGIAVDPYLLWVYGKEGFACATHASVMSFINRKRSMPLWLIPDPGSNIVPVLDLSSCEDKTLLVSSPDHLSTAVYHVDFKRASKPEGRGLRVEPWDIFPGAAGAAQVQKLPIFGWPLIESMMAAVNQPSDLPESALMS